MTDLANNISSSADISGKFALDVKGVEDLRQSARANSPEALKSAARQFEALFTNMMLKSMREASPQDGAFDSEQSKLYTSMLDQQLSQNMAKRGIGLADVLVRQLSNTVPGAMPTGALSDSTLTPLKSGIDAKPIAYNDTTVASSTDTDPGKVNPNQPKHVQDFHAAMASYAEDVSRSSGIPAKFMLGQAALETGWGKHQIKAANGTPSYNLFGIKAGSDWKGKTVSAVTTEYVDGVAQQRVEKFRAYDSYADSFKDYAKLLHDNPRYEKVMASASDASGFARGLQRAGYATDPNYAAKLTNIINRTMSA
jgi:flagellar protein FlgJ